MNRQVTAQTQVATKPTITPIVSGILQRQCACGQHTGGGECEKCKKKREGTLQRAAINPSPVYDVPPIVHEVLHSPGQPLDAATRAFMEPHFGHDFSRVSTYANGFAPTPAHLTIGAPHDDFEQEAEMMAQQAMSQSATSTSTGYDLSGVRVHTDGKAAESARAVNALAYTVGRDIVFGRGQYNPGTSAGTTLMAHELTHVIQQSGVSEVASTPAANARRPVTHLRPITGMIARQPASPEPGWTDAPKESLNRIITTIDDKGNIKEGKVTSKGVWRVPVGDLSHGFQGADKGPALESPKGRAIVLIPNTLQPAAPDDGGNISVDVLLHFHGLGIGYRQLAAGKQDYAQVLKEKELRDVDLYQMEQQLLSHVATSHKLLIAVLPQGSEGSDFGDLSSKSDAYLQEVLKKLIARNLMPKNAIPGRVIVSAHSGGGPRAMAIADQPAQAGKRTDVLLFDAINFGCDKEEKKVDGKTVTDKSGKPIMVCKEPKVCKSYEYGKVSNWVKKKIKEDVLKVHGKPEAEQLGALQADGTRFRGITSASLDPKHTEYTCGYGHWYSLLKGDIDTTINAQSITRVVRDQLNKNYQVITAKGTIEHERVMSGQNLEDALKD